MDLNHDKQIQSLLCYRYTIGHAGAEHNVEGFIAASSRQSSANVACAPPRDAHSVEDANKRTFLSLPSGEGDCLIIPHA